MKESLSNLNSEIKFLREQLKSGNIHLKDIFEIN